MHSLSYFFKITLTASFLVLAACGSGSRSESKEDSFRRGEDPPKGEKPGGPEEDGDGKKEPQKFDRLMRIPAAIGREMPNLAFDDGTKGDAQWIIYYKVWQKNKDDFYARVIYRNPSEDFNRVSVMYCHDHGKGADAVMYCHDRNPNEIDVGDEPVDNNAPPVGEGSKPPDDDGEEDCTDPFAPDCKDPF